MEIIHDLPEAEKVCPHDGTPLKRIDSEIHEQLDIAWEHEQIEGFLDWASWCGDIAMGVAVEK